MCLSFLPVFTAPNLSFDDISSNAMLSIIYSMSARKTQSLASKQILTGMREITE